MCLATLLLLEKVFPQIVQVFEVGEGALAGTVGEEGLGLGEALTGTVAEVVVTGKDDKEFFSLERITGWGPRTVSKMQDEMLAGKLTDWRFLCILIVCLFKLPAFLHILLHSLHAKVTPSLGLLHLCLDDPDLLVELKPQGQTKKVSFPDSTTVIFLLDAFSVLLRWALLCVLCECASRKIIPSSSSVSSVKVFSLLSSVPCSVPS
jgi:hypothetical protein